MEWYGPFPLADGTSNQQRMDFMSSQHRILVVGVGSIGERHARCFHETGRAEVSICELNPDLRQQVADRYSFSGSFGSLEEALENPPTAAVICTPAQVHIPVAQQLAEAGIHLLVEKPLSTSTAGITALQETLAAKELHSAVAYTWRSNPILRSFQQAIASGRFGRPLQVAMVSGQNFPFYRPAYRDIYYNNRATGGGAIQDALTHMLNAVEWLVGPMTSVAADAAHLKLEGVEVEDTVHVLARHGDVLSSFSLNQFQGPNESTVTVNCEEATVRLEAHHSRWRWQAGTEDTWHDETFPPMERDTPYLAQANLFLDQLEGKGESLCTLAEGLQTLKVNLAVLQAADTHTWQTISDFG